MQGLRLLPSVAAKVTEHVCTDKLAGGVRARRVVGQRFLGASPGRGPCQFVPLVTWPPLVSLKPGKWHLCVCARGEEELGLDSQPGLPHLFGNYFNSSPFPLALAQHCGGWSLTLSQ